MPAPRLTLQNRITSLMILSSLIFISTFTFIQINNQLSSINRYNTYQANLSGAILKNNLEVAIQQTQGSEERAKYLQQAIKELGDSNIIKETILFNREGIILASTEEKLIGEETSYRDINRWDTFNTDIQKDKWLNAEINKLKHTINIYIAIKPGSNDQLSYIAKTSFPFATIQEALATVYLPVTITIVIVILANILFGYTLSKTILGPIKVLNKTTKIIAEGDLTVRTSINTQDELQELGQTFNYMTEKLIKMKERAENANPLTKLPGNIIIHEKIERIIQDNKKFMVIYCDLDNFKAFNDKYGIGKGDEAIKMTAEIFKESAKIKGNPDDFVGHEGGDDFILLTTPDKAQAVADHIITEFDKQIRNLYNQDDLNQGFIIAHARDNSVKKFPIMTISLAGVTNAHREILSYGEVTNIAAEVKKKAKAEDGSVFVIDKRQNSVRDYT
jgi:diguanylate cyclase (GGDEF)-like protein